MYLADLFIALHIQTQLEEAFCNYSAIYIAHYIAHPRGLPSSFKLSCEENI